MDESLFCLQQGDKYPYDVSDAHGWAGEAPPPSKDWAHRAARGVIHNLQGRGGMDACFADVEEEDRVELVESLAGIIRLACELEKAKAHAGN